MIELSYTRNKDLGCPWRYQQLYLRNAQEPQSEPAAIGVLLHMLAARYGQHLVKLAQRGRRRSTDWDYVQRTLTELLDKAGFDDDQREFAEKLAGRFSECWKLDYNAQQHIFEVRFGIDRDLQPIKDIEPVDRFAGTVDHAWFISPTEAHLEDYKFGFRRFDDPFEGQSDPQLQGYAFLLMQHYPELQTVTGRLWAPLWGAKSATSGQWDRETLTEIMRERLGKKWAEIDRLRAEYGDDDWPAESGKGACRWCNLVLSCPKYLQMKESMNGARTAA